MSKNLNNQIIITDCVRMELEMKLKKFETFY